MSLRLSLAAAGILLLTATTAWADDDRPDHFEGQPSTNLGEAVTNLGRANAELEELLEAEELSASDMARIHELSYTMENALQRMQSELDTLAVTLEDIHQASERMDRATVREQGPVYLEGTRPLTR